jgi:hypothetical protein
MGGRVSSPATPIALCASVAIFLGTVAGFIGCISIAFGLLQKTRTRR